MQLSHFIVTRSPKECLDPRRSLNTEVPALWGLKSSSMSRGHMNERSMGALSVLLEQNRTEQKKRFLSLVEVS